MRQEAILIQGVATMDMVFDVPQIPNEAIKYKAQGFKSVLGGCATNAAIAASRLGANVFLSAPLGKDQIADRILADLQNEGIDLSLISQVDGVQTPLSAVMIDSTGERQIINYRNDLLNVSDNFDLSKIGVCLTDLRWPKSAKALLETAIEAKIPAIIDGEVPTNPDLAALATHVAFSARGLEDFITKISNKSANGLTLIEQLQLAKPCIPGIAIVTDGDKGSYALSHDKGDIIHQPAVKVKVVDSLGAGDVWHGAFAVGLLMQKNLQQAMQFANLASALKCTRKGGGLGAPYLQELNLFKQDSML